MPISHTIEKEGEEIILRIDLTKSEYTPSVEDSPSVMAIVIEKIIEVGNVTRIILYQNRDYEYDYYQTKLLVEIANVFKNIISNKDMFSYTALASGGCSKFYNTWYAELQYLIYHLLKSDPIGCYVELKRIIRRETSLIESATDNLTINCLKRYVSVLKYISSLLEKTKLINIARPYLAGYKLGDRTVYRRIFRPTIKPDFMFTKLMASYPIEGEEIDNYSVNDSEVTIFRIPGSVKILYHLLPPEFRLSEEKYEILDMARKIMAEHKPRRSEYADPERMREVFFNVGHDLIKDLALHKGYRLRAREIDELANILLRYTIGFGLIEVLLADENIQDISVNSPMGQTPIFIVHGQHGDCYTNIIPTSSEAESWASKLRIISGRPLDEANPILDTEITLKDVSARVAAITEPLNPSGTAFSFRRHRSKPWTLPLFMHANMLNPIAAGLLSFLIDGTRTILIAGTRSSGKTSLLGSLMVEIMPKYRIITVEDSITADTKIFYKENGFIKLEEVEKIFNKLAKNNVVKYKTGREIIKLDNKNIETISIGKDGKVCFAKAIALVRHKVNKKIYRLRTLTGREIKVTEDHSLFTLKDNKNLLEVKPKQLKKGNYIVVPRKLLALKQGKKYLNLYKLALKKKIKNCYLVINKNTLKLYEEKIKEKASKKYGERRINKLLREGILPLEITNPLFKNTKNIKIKFGKNKPIDALIKLDDEILTSFGLYLSKDFGKIKDSNLRKVFKLLSSKEKRGIPSWIFNLSKKQIGSFLKGIFSSCHVNDKEIILNSNSKTFVDEIATLLLMLGIISKIDKKKNIYMLTISRTEDFKLFKKYIGFLQKDKNKKLNILLKNKELKKESDFIFSNDILLDKIVEIKEINNGYDYVYDFCVPGYENFIAENILVHNTLELPTAHLRKLGYNVQPMKVASALARGTTELTATEGIRATLRLGDSALIVGEVRSKEAIALYEAMRVGAAANVVAGTIHSDSPYGVFDRVVNDIGIPRTSFKATDIIVIANPIVSADGLHKYRRVLQITEVRKHWQDDPLRENGFVDLLKYDAKKDTLEVTPELLNGDSEILKIIASKIREFAGNWQAVWDNILLRAKVKETLLNFARKTNNLELLEANFVVKANDAFHLISEKVKEEVGYLDNKRILFDFNEWLKMEIKRKKI